MFLHLKGVDQIFSIILIIHAEEINWFIFKCHAHFNFCLLNESIFKVTPLKVF